MCSLALKWTMAIVIILVATELTSAQKPSPTAAQQKSKNSSSKANFDQVLGSLPYQNSSKSFSQRFGKAPRISGAFHYPVLPDVYWSKHKRPYVPWIDPELYGDFDVSSNIV